MRRVYALFGLVRRYGRRPRHRGLHVALDAGMLDVPRAKRITRRESLAATIRVQNARVDPRCISTHSYDAELRKLVAVDLQRLTAKHAVHKREDVGDGCPCHRPGDDAQLAQPTRVTPALEKSTFNLSASTSPANPEIMT